MAAQAGIAFTSVGLAVVVWKCFANLNHNPDPREDLESRSTFWILPGVWETLKANPNPHTLNPDMPPTRSGGPCLQGISDST